MERWSHRNGWVKRARAWDEHLQEQRDKVALAEAQKWEARRLRSIERRYERSQALDARAQAMFEMPIVRKVHEKVERYDDGREKVVKQIFEPAGWRQRDVALIFQRAAEMEREAIDAALPPKVAEDRTPQRISDRKAEAMLEAASKLEEDYDPPPDD